MRRLSLALILLFSLSPVYADTVGVIRGTVLDPSGAVIPGSSVRLAGILGSGERAVISDAEGRFEFRFVEAGPYKIVAEWERLVPVEQLVTVIADQSVTVRLQFTEVAGVTTTVAVSASAAGSVLDVHTAAVQTGLSSRTVEHMPGASESLSAMEAQTGTAWRSQEHLHIRGAHQVGFEVNGIAIPDQSLFGAITPFIDPRTIKYAEITSSGLLPEFGNRTAGLINAITRSGFDYPGHSGLFEVAGGNLGRGSVFASYGDHVGEKFAYYLQASSLTNRRGFNPPPDRIANQDLDGNGRPDILDSPKRQDRHNGRRGYQSFANVEWLANQRDTFNFVLGGYRTDFQVPNTIEQDEFGRDYVQFERDHFQNVRWMRTLSSDTLLTVSGHHHFNKLEISGRVDDVNVPLAGDNRRANYYGGEASIARYFGRHLLKAGGGMFATRLRDDFSILPNPRGTAAGRITPVHSRVPAHAWEYTAYMQDQFDLDDRWTLNYGTRLDVLQTTYETRNTPPTSQDESFLSPRFGFAYKISSSVALFGNAGYLFVLPPIEFFELPPDAGQPGSVFPEGVRYTPPRAERDVQYDVGLRFLVKGQKLRINQWLKSQIGFLDHAQFTQLNGVRDLINPNIFLPVNLDRGRTHGVEVFLETSSYRGLSGYVNYSMNYSQAAGGVIHGFFDGSGKEPGYFFVDHDQRHRVSAGMNYDIEQAGAFVNLIYNYGSGFPDSSDGLFGACVTPACRLPGHSEISATVGKKLSERVLARLEIENLTNNVYPINTHSDFNGSHVSQPRLVSFRLAYRF